MKPPTRFWYDGARRPCKSNIQLALASKRGGRRLHRDAGESKYVIDRRETSSPPNALPRARELGEDVVRARGRHHASRGAVRTSARSAAELPLLFLVPPPPPPRPSPPPPCSLVVPLASPTSARDSVDPVEYLRYPCLDLSTRKEGLGRLLNTAIVDDHNDMERTFPHAEFGIQTGRRQRSAKSGLPVAPPMSAEAAIAMAESFAACSERS